MKLRMVFSGPWERERDQKIVFKSHILHLLGLWPPTCPKVGQHVGNFLSRGHLWCHHYCKGSSTWVLPSMLPPPLRRGEVEWLSFTGATSLPVLSLVLSMRQLAAHTCVHRGPMLVEYSWGARYSWEAGAITIAWRFSCLDLSQVNVHSVCMRVGWPEEILFYFSFAFGKRYWH